MSMQEALFTCGRVAFVAACLLLIATVWYAIARDVRGIRDDLSGRRRQRGIEQALRGRTSASLAYRRLEMARAKADEQVALTQVFEQNGPGVAQTLVAEGEADPVAAGAFSLTHETIVCGVGDLALTEGGRQ